MATLKICFYADCKNAPDKTPPIHFGDDFWHDLCFKHWKFIEKYYAKKRIKAKMYQT